CARHGSSLYYYAMDYW
nr:immunoglobulin heavy chain junction region [Mus musculus]NSM04739.1 immunoglobulin heavy chain junction region [Mus musculus]NSM05242.1 immunoglobulin heavy chain junction region [Mus musculus]NSM06278.1 immunoglobulin heavy chain junction region [Mus musculus]NSM06720.1 immunoglobulin heavy chain junction region [Mus musculus]